MWLCGYSVATMWLPCGYHVATMWLPCGDYVATGLLCVVCLTLAMTSTRSASFSFRPSSSRRPRNITPAKEPQEGLLIGELDGEPRTGDLGVDGIRCTRKTGGKS